MPQLPHDIRTFSPIYSWYCKSPNKIPCFNIGMQPAVSSSAIGSMYMRGAWYLYVDCVLLTQWMALSSEIILGNIWALPYTRTCNWLKHVHWQIWGACQAHTPYRTQFLIFTHIFAKKWPCRRSMPPLMGPRPPPPQEILDMPLMSLVKMHSCSVRT